MPEQFAKKIIDIFNEEISRQNVQSRKTHYARNIEAFAEFIYYDQAKYIDAFNQILYNQLLKQAKRNDEVKLQVVDEKIIETEVEAMTFYEKINSQVSGDADSADNFVEIILLSLYETLKRELVSNFESHVYQIETEPDLMKE